MPATVTLGQSVNFTAYGVARTDGASNVILVNKDPTLTVVARVSAGVSVSAMLPMSLTGQGLSSTTGLLLGNAAIGADGFWSPQGASALPAAQGQLTVNVAPMSAMLLRSV